MYIRLNSRRGQNTAEYAILIGVIVAAAIAMQVYVRRGVQARIKESVDFSRTADDQAGNAIFTQTQYEPYYSAQNTTQSQSARQSESMAFGGVTTRNTIEQIASVRGNQTAGNYMMGN
jgi:gas vesicle protein